MAYDLSKASLEVQSTQNHGLETLGSGMKAIILGTLDQECGGRIWAVEHDGRYGISIHVCFSSGACAIRTAVSAA